MINSDLLIKSSEYTLLYHETKKLVFERIKENYSKEIYYDDKLNELLDKIIPLHKELKQYLEGKD